MSEPLPEVQMHEMCATCAYRDGTFPNLDLFTKAKRMVCEELGEPFLCHANRDRAGELIPGEPSALCAGFTAVFAKRVREGYYEKQSREKRALFVAISDDLDRIAEIVAHPASDTKPEERNGR